MGVKKIKLTQGKFALVDARDFKRISAHKWCYITSKKQRGGYAKRRAKKKLGEKGTLVFMHYMVLDLTPNKNFYLDHINNNTLDNRRKNLRKANATEQSQNRRTRKDNLNTGLKGVSAIKDRRGVKCYWIAQIQINKKRIYLGAFKNKIKAHAAYKKAAAKYFKEFACKKPN